MHRYDEALELLLFTIDECEEEERIECLAETHKDIATIYGLLNEFEKSKLNIDLSLGFYEQLGVENENIARAYNNAGIIYKNLNQIKRAIEFHRKSALIKSNLNDSIGVINSLNNIGECFRIINQFDSAMWYYQRGIVLTRFTRDEKSRANLLNNIAATYDLQGKTDSAIYYYQLALPLASQLNYDHLSRRIHLYLSKIYAEKQDSGIAFLHYQAYALLNDTILRLEAYDRIAEIETKHQLIQVEKEKALLEQEKELAEQKTQIQLIVLAFFGLLVLIGCLMAFYRQRKKITIAKEKSILQEEALEKGRKEASQAAHQIFHEINNNLIAMQVNYRLGREEERKIGDQILKDTVKQNTRIANMLWRQENPDNHAED